MLDLRETRFIDRRVALTLHDGNRLIAKARPVGGRGYLVVGYGICLLDKRPHPMAPTGIGKPDPTRYNCDLREARRVMRRLAAAQG